MCIRDSQITESCAFADQLYPEQYANQPDGRYRKTGPKIESQQYPEMPLAKTQPQFGNGRIVNEKITFEMPSIMKNTIRSSVSVRSPSPG